MTTRYISSKAVSVLKKQAKVLSRTSDDISHTQALESVAIKQGFDNWHQVTLANKPMKEAEDVLKNGVYIVFDNKDAEDFYDEDKLFVKDDLGEFVCRDLLTKYFGALQDEETGKPIRDSLSDEDFREFIEDELFAISFIRYRGELPEMDKQDLYVWLMEKLSPFSMWLPQLVVIKGEAYSPF